MSDFLPLKCTDCDLPVTVVDENLPNDTDIITCKGCGRTFGTYAEVKKALVELGNKALDETIAKADLQNWIRRD